MPPIFRWQYPRPLLIASYRHLYTPKFCRTVALIQKGTQTIVLPSGNLYASDFCMGNVNNRLRSADVRFSKLKMPKFTHFSMETNGSQCIRTGARRKTCVASLAECPCNNVRFQSRSVSMVKSICTETIIDVVFDN